MTLHTYMYNCYKIINILMVKFYKSIAKSPLHQPPPSVFPLGTTTISPPVTTISPVFTQDLQGDVNEINSWMQSHGLTANHSKTKLLTITRSTRTIPMNIDINNHRISPCDTVKYLGVTVNNDLKWACHIHNTCKKAKQHLGFIHRKFHKSPPQIRNQIYRTAVLPKLDYCGAVWDPHHHTDIKKLESVQKFAGKIVTKQWRAEYPDLLASLNWKPLSSRRKNQKLKVCFNILNNLSIISPNVFTLHPRPSPRHPHNQIIFKPC